MLHYEGGKPTLCTGMEQQRVKAGKTLFRRRSWIRLRERIDQVILGSR